jgi:hypothetical protein
VAVHQHLADRERRVRAGDRSRAGDPITRFGMWCTAIAPNRVVVLNGRFASQLSRVNGLPHGVRVGSLAAR